MLSQQLKIVDIPVYHVWRTLISSNKNCTTCDDCFLGEGMLDVRGHSHLQWQRIWYLSRNNRCNEYSQRWQLFVQVYGWGCRKRDIMRHDHYYVCYYTHVVLSYLIESNMRIFQGRVTAAWSRDVRLDDNQRNLPYGFANCIECFSVVRLSIIDVVDESEVACLNI